MQVTIPALLVAAVLGFSHGASVMRIEPSEPLEQVVKAKPVNLTIYYESKCESCGYFIVDQVGPVWKKLEDSGIFSVYFIPYGNAQETKVGDKWNFTCQHGPWECDGNLVETCAIHFYPKEHDHMDFIVCFEDKFDMHWEKTLKECGKVAKIPEDKVQEIAKCVRGDLGNKLEHQMALRTGPHQSVPWILIDGKLNMDTEKDLLTPVCNAYQGTKPAACPK